MSGIDFTLTDKEKNILLTTAKYAISSDLYDRKENYPRPTSVLRQKCGAFVTLTLNHNLRGCIGYVIAAKPLIETVKDVAVSAAFHDPRFSPVTKKEFDKLKIEISVLSPLEEIDDVNKIKVGVHGIVIRKGFASGLLLPQVATEYNWDLHTFLNQTCRKAGLKSDAWKEPGTRIEIFSAIVFNEDDIKTN
ncbi:MAG: AmmeMemoRadiSam system protein A [Spirochaetales bacterium]|nr:AmmeMemoRadiSam system protein A [Spirochaetales bacterium]